MALSAKKLNDVSVWAFVIVAFLSFGRTLMMMGLFGIPIVIIQYVLFGVIVYIGTEVYRKSTNDIKTKIKPNRIKISFWWLPALFDEKYRAYIHKPFDRVLLTKKEITGYILCFVIGYMLSKI